MGHFSGSPSPHRVAAVHLNGHISTSLIPVCPQEHFEDVKLREEKAMSEQQQLQQKLKLDRIQWQKQAHLARAQEDALVANLIAMRTSHAATLHQLRTENQDLQQAFDAEYEEYAVLCKYCLAAFAIPACSPISAITAEGHSSSGCLVLIASDLCVDKQV